jgi:hypothetical protein
MEELGVDFPNAAARLVSLDESQERNRQINAGLTRPLLRDFLSFIKKEGYGFDFAWDD